MRTRAGASFSVLLRSYLAARRGYDAHDRWRAERILPVFFSWLEKRRLRDARAVGEADVVSFLAWLVGETDRRGNPVSEGFRQEWLATLRSFFAHLLERRFVLMNPAEPVRLPRSARLPPPVLSEARARRLMGAPSSTTNVGLRDRAILELLYGTGIRLGECVRLDLSDVSLLERQLLVRSGKGKKDRVVPLVGQAAAAIDLYLRDVRPELAKSPREEAVFLSRDGCRLTRTGLQQRLALYGQALGLRQKLRPHVLRHTCATQLLAGGADIRHVQRLLGHKDLRTTAVYTRVDVSDLRAVIERAHPRR